MFAVQKRLLLYWLVRLWNELVKSFAAIVASFFSIKKKSSIQV